MADLRAPSGTVSWPYRIPVAGGTPQRLPWPTYGGHLQTEVTQVLAAPDDRRFAYVIDTGKITSGYASTYRLVVTELGGATISLPGTDPIGWVDDNHLLLWDSSAAWPALVVRSVDVTHPVVATTVLFTSVEDPASPGPCAGPIEEAGTAAMPDQRLVITRSRCSAGLVAVIDLRTGAQSNVRLPPRYSAVYP